jgi:hypothetical protein
LISRGEKSRKEKEIKSKWVKEIQSNYQRREECKKGRFIKLWSYSPQQWDKELRLITASIKSRKRPQLRETPTLEASIPTLLILLLLLVLLHPRARYSNKFRIVAI